MLLFIFVAVAFNGIPPSLAYINPLTVYPVISSTRFLQSYTCQRDRDTLFLWSYWDTCVLCFEGNSYSESRRKPPYSRGLYIFAFGWFLYLEHIVVSFATNSSLHYFYLCESAMWKGSLITHLNKFMESFWYINHFETKTCYK